LKIANHSLAGTSAAAHGLLGSSRQAALQRVLHDASAAILLAILAGRCFLSETPFRLSMMRWSTSPGGEASAPLGELARVSFALLLLLALALWAVGQALNGSAKTRFPWFGALSAAFAVAAGCSVAFASDRAAAVMSAVEQTSFLAAGFLAMQLFGDRRRLSALMCVLMALAVAMSIKAYWQVFVETPDRIADFDANKLERLASLNYPPDSPQAIAFENRLKSPAPFGYLSLANPFASLMLLLTAGAVGLSIDNLRHAIRKLKTWKHNKGEIHVPTFAAVIGVAVSAATGVVVLLTRSRGAILAAAVVTLCAIAVAGGRRFFARHWGKTVIVALAVFVVAAATVLWYGAAHDRLPSKTMTYRWFYWTGAAQIVKESPLLGVGGGNFGQAYLRHRRAEAEEAVKMPHNVFADVVSQYGLVGGLPFLAMLIGVLVCASRPRPEDSPADDADHDLPRPPKPLLAAAALGVLATRLLFGEGMTGLGMLLLEVLIPLVIFTGALILGAWIASACRHGSHAVWRFVLPCGLLAFFLHCMVEDNLSFPAPALAFWVIAGACLSGAAARSAGGSRLAKPRAAILVVAVVALVVCVWRPVFVRTRWADKALKSHQAGHAALAIRFATEAAQADRLDSFAPADAARLLAASYSQQAYAMATEAIKRNPAGSSHQQLAFNIALRLATDGDKHWLQKAMNHAAAAVALNPMDHRFRLEAAQACLAAGLPEQAREHLAHARKVNDALLAMSIAYPPPSVEIFSGKEMAELEMLEKQCPD